MKRSTALLPLAALSALLALAGCKKPPAKTTDAERARAVRVVQVQPMAITGALAASGDLLPREEAAVLPEVTGYRVARVLADVGDYVKQGQTLVQLDPVLLQSQLAQAQAQAAQAEDQAKRVEGLDNQGVLSQEQIAQRRFQAQVAQANLKDLQTRMRKMAVTAPVSGLILERTVRPGDLSAGGTTPWFRLARDGEVELAAQVSDDNLTKLRPGQAAQINLPNGKTVTGHVRIISPQIDAQTKLGIVRIHLPVDRDIRSGGFARAVFADATGSALAVPETAVRYDADGPSVMVVGADNRVHRVLVQAGARGSGLVQLTKSPPVGTRVVQSAAAFLLDGDMIKPVDVATPTAAAPAVSATK